MHPIFGNFDFAMLEDPDFKEDSVREEIVVPLLTALGYSAAPPHKIIRSRRLEHPFVYIGSIRKPITIIPDYLLQRDSTNTWILDAKAPDEIIDSGKNVEQAFSYAIHKDVRVPLFALCNGRRLTVYHISHWPALLDIDLKEIESHWGELFSLLSTRSVWPGGIPVGFRPDFGLAVKMSGLDVKNGEKVVMAFASFNVRTIAKVDEDTYSVNAVCGLPEEGEFMATFDFPMVVYKQFLSVLSADTAAEVTRALHSQPFVFTVPPEGLFIVGAVAELGDTVYSNENESYCPLIASEFVGPETRAG